ncbi:hypothetical protein MAPG_02107 [Magnaporthiopsis poae ATCC 64411]|uniref:37S ribosomal protein Rsm22 n=1 Tax=Magnaporthiopsis poae (strain ATCC 64411 / 73-15) TaxID=644358 RepID=A0A0C4DQG7_MAGP6|nr:hypothetical protein MAPG_02107 [Magnaporthiopsis poae ATCC 64411]
MLIDVATGLKRRELEWLLDELHATLKNLKHGLEDCYALLAPIDPGSTLVVSTPRNEAVKGHITRVGTRIVKGTLSLRLRTIPPQTLSLDPDHPIHLAPLTHLHGLLTDALDVLTQTLAHLPEPAPPRTSDSQSTRTDDDGYNYYDYPTARSPNPGAAAFLLGGGGNGGSGAKKGPAQVYVREKIRVESADPSLLSLSAKLGALSNTLGIARRNLAAVMGEEMEE